MAMTKDKPDWYDDLISEMTVKVQEYVNARVGIPGMLYKAPKFPVKSDMPYGVFESYPIKDGRDTRSFDMQDFHQNGDFGLFRHIMADLMVVITFGVNNGDNTTDGWARVDFRYNHIGSGSNGFTLPISIKFNLQGKTVWEV